MGVLRVAFWGGHRNYCVVLAQERILLAFRLLSGFQTFRVMAKAMRAAAMKAMKAVRKGTKQAIVPTKAMRAAAMKAMKVVSKEAKEQAFVATKAMRKAKAAAPAPMKAMKAVKATTKQAIVPTKAMRAAAMKAM